MATVTLLIKAFDESRQKLVARFIKSALDGLKIRTEFLGITSRGWIRLAVSGEDENVALRYLEDEIGLCAESLENIVKFSSFKGCITALDKSKDGLKVDIGIFLPQIVGVTIPLRYLQAQLADGRKINIPKLAELFGFYENVPLTVKIVKIDRKKNYVEAMLSETEIVKIRSWTLSLLDRLIIFGVPVHDVKLALKRLGLNRDILNIESLGLFESACVCKLGTDAAGLIPKIGRTLHSAIFVVFSPKRTLEFFDYSRTLICA